MSKIFIFFTVMLALAWGFIYYLPNLSKNQDFQTTAAARTSIQQTSVKEFIIDAKRWDYSPSVITVKKGQTVKIAINNTDTPHGINLPDFDVAGDDSVEFVADKIGEFTFYCQVYCGKGHPDMQGKIIVTE